jgi:hypothetical protein
VDARWLAIGLGSLAFIAAAGRLPAGGIVLASPDHEQTWTSGTEARRAWGQSGNHLVLYLDFTNDPYVDRENPRQYDSFTFSFPQVRVGRNGHVFYARHGGRDVPVAVRSPDALGVNEVHLLPNSELLVAHPHGYLSLALQVHESDVAAAQ